jgi:hypothetical protein
MPIAQVVLFEHANFEGAQKEVFGENPNLNTAEDNFFNDKTSSFVIVEGQWEFFDDWNYIGKLGPTLGPGRYAWVEAPDALGPGSNDQISSLRSVSS